MTSETEHESAFKYSIYIYYYTFLEALIGPPFYFLESVVLENFIMVRILPAWRALLVFLIVVGTFSTLFDKSCTYLRFLARLCNLSTTILTLEYKVMQKKV